MTLAASAGNRSWVRKPIVYRRLNARSAALPNGPWLQIVVSISLQTLRRYTQVARYFVRIVVEKIGA
ncbi:MAG: hypothetical protein CMJ75_06240 [Planctomycetaceae bacterium]|nr:hypothetical protein [Planctomycetaceae bacterium]